jgi:hypothetical protein
LRLRWKAKDVMPTKKRARFGKAVVLKRLSPGRRVVKE